MLMATDATSLFSYSLATNTRLLEYQEHTQWVRSFQFKKNMMVSTSEDRTLKVCVHDVLRERVGCCKACPQSCTFSLVRG